MDKIKVLVVDDSYFMRQAISKILSSADIEVAGEAKNGREAVELVKKLNPNVVTMDIEMPVMTGLEALEKIMAEYPVPVLMVSTLTSEGADATIDAMSLGAVDFITKRAAFREMDSIKDELIAKVKAVGGSTQLQRQMIRCRLLGKISAKEKTGKHKPFKIAAPQEEKKSTVSLSGRKRPSPKDIQVVAVGISTGGPPALQKMLSKLPPDLPVPVLIVQHMPAYFTNSLAKRLDANCSISVKEAQTQDDLLPGKVFIAPGGRQMIINKMKKLIITDQPENELYKPSVNVMLDSVLNIYGKNALCVIMTGMGSDGTESLKKLFNAGAYVLAQDADTCVVGGMPNSAVKAQVVDEVHPLSDMAAAIASCLGKKAAEQ